MKIKYLLKHIFSILLLVFLAACDEGSNSSKDFDVIISNGTLYDGLGNDPVNTDIGIIGDSIAQIGNLKDFSSSKFIDATDMSVAPGFINMLSWATQPLLIDGRALSDIKQGVTLEIMGEGSSMGPLNDSMKVRMKEQQSNIKYDITWTTLNEYLERIVSQGVSVNVASYIGASTVRVHEIGYENRKPTATELIRMQNLVETAMLDGAMGVGSSLIYTPGTFADTDELIALVRIAAKHNGAYISHLRSEANLLEESVLELIKIASITGAPAEIYHLKAAGKKNWHKLENVFNLIESARNSGLRISADMYTYPAAATGLDATMPPWVQEGGHDEWVKQLQIPSVRERVSQEMLDENSVWENFFMQAGPEGILLTGFRNSELKKYTGMTLQEVSELRGTSPQITAMDLVIEDNSRIDAVFFLMSEDNVTKQIKKPWISFGSDAGAIANEGVFLEKSLHPRAYGNFARVIGKYVRDEQAITMKEAIRRLTSLPAKNTGIQNRGSIQLNNYADIIIFDPEEVNDKATFEEPHQYAVGMKHVFVNGEQVLKDGEHTGALPGQIVRGPGWRGWNDHLNQ
jgi:N-acyl-D-amino-acid deacylase